MRRTNQPTSLKGLLVLGLIALVVGLSWGGWLFWSRRESQDTSPGPLALPTPPPQHFILMGDTGSGLPAQKAVAIGIRDYCLSVGSCEAAFILGDVIYDEGVQSVDDPQFQTKFETPYQELTFPFFIAYGNHDYLGCTQCYLDYSQRSRKWRMPAPYYQQTLGETSFFVIDTEQFDQEQQAWLAQALAQDHSRWKIVVGHRPVVSFEETKYTEDWHGKAELQALLCHSVDVYAAGHAHVLEDNGSPAGCTFRQLIAGGGGASSRQLVQPNQSLFAHESYGFLALTPTGQALHFSFLDQAGTVLYQASVTKQ